MSVKTIFTLVALSAGALLTAETASAQAASKMQGPHITLDAKLSAEAKVSETSARETALKAVPGGKVQDGELEREHGKLIYSYDIKVAGKSGIEEIAVDAITGAVVAHEHETPAMMRKEAAADAKEKKSTKKS
ncbi:MAG: PepSY domain-containing protein [bacterium]